VSVRICMQHGSRLPPPPPGRERCPDRGTIQAQGDPPASGQEVLGGRAARVICGRCMHGTGNEGMAHMAGKACTAKGRGGATCVVGGAPITCRASRQHLCLRPQGSHVTEWSHTWLA
jgi:hypothetical protein